MNPALFKFNWAKLYHGRHEAASQTMTPPPNSPRDAKQNFAPILLARKGQRSKIWGQALNAYFSGDTAVGKTILRDLVNATIGFEQLATLTAKPSKSLLRMLSPTGNPSMDNLAAIFRAVRERLHVNLTAHSVAA